MAPRSVYPDCRLCFPLHPQLDIQYELAVQARWWNRWWNRRCIGLGGDVGGHTWPLQRVRRHPTNHTDYEYINNDFTHQGFVDIRRGRCKLSPGLAQLTPTKLAVQTNPLTTPCCGGHRRWRSLTNSRWHAGGREPHKHTYIHKENITHCSRNPTKGEAPPKYKINARTRPIPRLEWKLDANPHFQFDDSVINVMYTYKHTQKHSPLSTIIREWIVDAESGSKGTSIHFTVTYSRDAPSITNTKQLSLWAMPTIIFVNYGRIYSTGKWATLWRIVA